MKKFYQDYYNRIEREVVELSARGGQPKDDERIRYSIHTSSYVPFSTSPICPGGEDNKKCSATRKRCKSAMILEKKNKNGDGMRLGLGGKKCMRLINNFYFPYALLPIEVSLMITKVSYYLLPRTGVDCKLETRLEPRLFLTAPLNKEAKCSVLRLGVENVLLLVLLLLLLVLR